MWKRISNKESSSVFSTFRTQIIYQKDEMVVYGSNSLEITHEKKWQSRKVRTEKGKKGKKSIIRMKRK